MAHPEQHYRWAWTLSSPPAALWPLVSNTDRFNRDCGYPPVTRIPPAPGANGTVTNARRLRAVILGVPIEWDELAFEWQAPRRFAVERTFHDGPVARMQVRCELTPTTAGGTTLVYEMRLTPSNLLGRVALPFSIGRRARLTMDRVFQRYDEFAQRGLRTSQLAQRPKLTLGGADRLATLAQALVSEAAQPAPLVAKLQTFIATADDLSVTRLRPYALADEWGVDRSQTLQLFLHATRAGLLDFSWDLVCPHCRGPKASATSLARVSAQAHCDTCAIDFTVNFDQSVELTFSPNAAIRAVAKTDYCVGGPQMTPHILAQQRIAPGERQVFRLELADGRYRVRAAELAAQQLFRIARGGADAAMLALAHPTADEPVLSSASEVAILNDSTTPRLVAIEHLAWTDQATTAAEVTALQLFRDLFSREVLRPGEQIRVGAMTVVFTDLKNSTQMYQKIGDAPAFGHVLTHFEILRNIVASEGGCVVKTMGDAIMAVFPRPVVAVRAMVHAQRALAHPQAEMPSRGRAAPTSPLQPLALKAGIHTGPCLAINQNDRLDYFGTTVNVTARLCGLCTGSDIVLSAKIAADPEVQTFLQTEAAPRCCAERVTLKGFGDAAFSISRLLTAV